MFRVSLRQSTGGRIAFHCLWFSVLFIVVVMLETRVARCVHCDEDDALQYPRHSAHILPVRPPDDGRKDPRNMLRNN
jgi:hypothetical protein